MAKKFSRRWVKELSPEKIGKFTAPEMIETLEGMRNLLNQQKILDKDRVWSPAVDKLRDYYEDKGYRPIEKYSPNKQDRAKAMEEIFRLKEFFGAKTSTIPGAQKVAREQDIRLFGKDAAGNPKKRLTYEERDAMWSAYEDFLSLHPNVFSMVEKNPSETVQQYFAEMAKGRNSRDDWTVEDFIAAYDSLTKADSGENMERENYAYKDSDILSGTRPY